MLTTLLSRSVENPATGFADPEEWFVDWSSGGKNLSGVRVNHNVALTYPPVWEAVNLISRDVARLPLLIYRRTSGGKKIAKKHPAYPILKRKASRWYQSYHLRLTLTAHALLHGNGYAFIVKDQGGRPKELVPLSPIDIDPRVTTSGRLIYFSYSENSAINPDQIIHIRALSDGFKGMSIVTKARESFGLGIAAQRYGATYFAHGSKPSVVLEHPRILKPERIKQLRQQWSERYEGVENAHKVAILEEGMTLKPFSISNENAQFLETRKFQTKDVAAWFNLPPGILAGDESHTSYASSEVSQQAYLDKALDPWLTAWEVELWEKLLTERQKQEEQYAIEFMRQALLKMDASSRASFYGTALLNGWMNRDEVREKENLNPIPEGEGKKFFYPLNVGILGEEKEEPQQLPPPNNEPPPEPDGDGQDNEPEEPRSEFRINLNKAMDINRACVQRCISRVTIKSRNMIKKSREQYLSWINEKIDSANRRVFNEYLAEGLIDNNTEDISKEILERLKTDLIDIKNADQMEVWAKMVEKTYPDLYAEKLLGSNNNGDGKATLTVSASGD